jgi:hypothetical protein
LLKLESPPKKFEVDPMRLGRFAFALSLCAVAPAVIVASDSPTSLGATITAAPRAIVGHVTSVQSHFGSNKFGDQLILSRVNIVVDEVLKGDAVGGLQLEVEGGTVGDLTLDVSDMPKVKNGDRAVFLVSAGPNGTFEPFGRGRGILHLDAGDRVKGRTMTLDEIRRLCAPKR